jgi:hypothetical protein
MLQKKLSTAVAFSLIFVTQAMSQAFSTNINLDFNSPTTYASRLGRTSIGQLIPAGPPPPVNNDFRLRVFGGPIAQVQTGTYGNFAAANQWIGLGQNPVLNTIYGMGMFRDDRYAFYNLQTTTRNAVATKDLIIGAGTTGAAYDANQRILIKGFFSPAGTNSRTLASFNPAIGAMGINDENPLSTVFVNGTTAATTAGFRNIFLLTTGNLSTPANVVASTYTTMGPEGNNPLTLNSNGFRAQSGNNAGNLGLIAANFTVNTTNQLATQQQEAEIQWQDLNYGGIVTHGFTGAAQDVLSFYFRNNVNNVNTRRRVMTMLGGAHVGINVAGNPVTTAGVNPLQAGNVFNTIRLHVNQGSILAEGYYSTSDSSVKTNIRDIDDPIGLMAAIKPRKYDFRVNGYADQTALVPQYGFIAQELAGTKVGELVSKMDNGLLAVQYDQMIPILTAGMQKQQAVIVTQQADMAVLREQNANQERHIRALMDWSLTVSEKLGIPAPVIIDVTPLTPGASPVAGRVASGNTGSETAANGAVQTRLLQNAPNPTNGFTEIFYSLAEGATGSLNVIDQNGRIAKAVNNLPKGNGKVTINRGELQPGTYTYTLFADGKVIGSRQLVIVR